MSATNKVQVSGCCGLVIVLIINLIFGPMSVHYVLSSFTGQRISDAAALGLGIFYGSATRMVAITCWILRLFGVEAPFIH